MSAGDTQVVRPYVGLPMRRPATAPLPEAPLPTLGLMPARPARSIPLLPLVLEAAGFLAIALVIWLDELIDLPHLLFNAPASPFRPHEALLESGLVLALGALIIDFTAHSLSRHIERLIVLCAWCHKVRLDRDWVSVEEFLREHHADTSHGMCPECERKMVAEMGSSRGRAA